ncbi:MAG: preprotein translocase subunit SecY [Pseudomonadota bacterium]|nr:preprotein translocase subunit SecY [Pseudomonadota bacterium]
MNSSLGHYQESAVRSLLRKVGFLLAGVVIFRIGVQTPIPGVNLERVAELMAANKSNMLLGYFDIFTGGALTNMSLLALSIYPYISASIAIQLLSYTVPHLQSLRKDGEKGRITLNQYTRYFTLALAIVESFGISRFVLSMDMAIVSSVYFQLLAIVSLTTGTMFMMWLGDQITRYGLGNGISVLIFSGIVSKLPAAIVSFLSEVRQGLVSGMTAIAVAAMITAIVMLVVCIERALRKISLTYPRRQHGRQSQIPESASMLPLKLNMSGVLPPIVAQMLIVFPITAIDYMGRYYSQSPIYAYLSKLAFLFQPGQALYIVLFSGLVLTFTYYLTGMFFNTNEIASHLKRSGAMIAGIRPGNKTSVYLTTIMTRLTFCGGLYLALIASAPDILIRFLKVRPLFGGTSLLITVVVVMEFMTQVRTHLINSDHGTKGSKKTARLKLI